MGDGKCRRSAAIKGDVIQHANLIIQHLAVTQQGNHPFLILRSYMYTTAKYRTFDITAAVAAVAAILAPARA